MFLDSLLSKFRQRKLSRKGYVSARQRRQAAREVAQFTVEKRTPRSLAIGVFSILWLGAAISIFYERTFTAHDFVVGQTIPRDIYSEVPFEYENAEKTAFRRDEARRQVPPVYRIEDTKVEAVRQTFGRVRDALSITAQEPDDNQDKAAEEISEVPIADPRVQQLFEKLAGNDALEPLEAVFGSGRKSDVLATLLRLALRQGVAAEKLDETFAPGMTGSDEILLVDPQSRRSQRMVSDLFTPRTAAADITEKFRKQLPETDKKVLHSLRILIEEMIQPNIEFDADATHNTRAQAASEVEVVRESVQAGAPLLRGGETVDPADLDRLNAHAAAVRARRAESGTFREVMVSLTLVLILTAIFSYGLRLISPAVFLKAPSLMLVGTIVLLQILLSRLALDIYSMNYSSSIYLSVLTPLAFGPMLLALLLDVRTAIWVGLFTTVITAMQAFESFPLLMTGAAAAFAGAVCVQHATKRHHMLRAGLAVGLVLFVVSAIYVADNEMPARVLPQLLGFAMLNGIITAMVASTILPVFEYVFGATTDISLLELSDLNHPLLKRLQMEAPGTYHHSLMVATLAEQAAASTGGNPLLARVCAYFHDIGKISQAEYFTENINLTGGRNPHDELQPRMSSLIILNHVKGGLELAAKYKLKKVIREAIAQHHGSSLIAYFYNRARQKNGESNKKQNAVEPQNYRYPGPPPCRKEIALISIADACEAAARSLEKPTPQKIQQLVDKIVYGRIQDGQLDRADLTFRELAVGKATIASTLGNMLHVRVSYDEEQQKEKQTENRPAQTDEDAAAPKSEAAD